MAYSLIIPNLKQPSVKDIILTELSQNKGCSITHLLQAARAKGITVTYHAIYQALKDLERNEIVERTWNEYSISKNYITSLHDFVQTLHSTYEQKASLNLKPNTTVHLSFRSMNETTRFFARAAYSNVFNTIRNREIYFVFQHLWLIQTIKGVRSIDIVKKLAKLNCWYALIQGNTLVDQKLKEYYEKTFNANIKLGVESTPFGNMVISGDILIETFIPKRLHQVQEKVFNSATNRFDLDWIESYTKLCYLDKYPIHATVTRNHTLVQQIQENIRKRFS
jgi:hypothetical protein